MDYSVTVDDFHTICRICLTPKNDMITFFSPTITYMLESCTSIQEIPNKKMPQQICIDCYEQLQNAFHFKQQYLLSIQILTEIILQSENCDKNETNTETQVQKKQNHIDNDEDSIRKVSEVQNDDVTTVFNAEIESDSRTNKSDNECDERIASDNYTIASNKEIMKKIEKTTMYRRRTKTKKRFSDKVSCDKCGKIFKREYFRRHMKRHSDNRPHECNICHSKFKQSFNLNRHKKIYHSSVNDAKELCFICGKFLIISLKAHLKTHTEISETDQFKCEQCDKIYGREKSLREHIRLRHSTIATETYSCKICNKVMTLKQSLNRHMKNAHSDLKQYVCLHCNKRFKTKDSLDVHIKAVHLNERPHSCTMCGKNFNTQQILTNHMRTHTGERPFSCQICKKSFSFRAALSTHMKQHSK